MIVRLQRDFLNTLRQQQQAEDDEYSDDEVCALNFTNHRIYLTQYPGRRRCSFASTCYR